MNCEFNLCIYNYATQCILNEIEINVYGMCDSCVLIDIPESIIDELKQDKFDAYIADNESE